MVQNPFRMSSGFQFAGKVLFLLIGACSVTNVYCQPNDRLMGVYDVTARPMALIQPGTVIGNRPPQGWSHLIIKSFPRTTAGDMDKVSNLALQMSSLLSTAFLANVEAVPGQGASPPHYRLGAMAIGFATRIQGKDTIISPDTQRQLGADFGFIARQVLAAAYERQQDARVVARSETSAIVDTPAYMLRGTRHRPVILRYALLVDAQTGRLDTLLWLIDRDNRGGYVGPSSPMQWLPPNKIQDCEMHVDAGEFTLGVAAEDAFAIMHIPRGVKEIPFSDDLKGLAAQPRLSAGMATAMEGKLREALRRAASTR
jgi:hypothetical protein